MKFRIYLLALAMTLYVSAGASFYTPFEERDLELFEAPSRSHEGFVSLFEKQCYTTAGRQALRNFFMHPLTSVSDITARQQAIKALTHNEVCVSVARDCKSFGASESSLDAIMAYENNPVFKDMLKSFYFGWASFQNLNHSATALNTRYYAQLLMQLYPVLEHAWLEIMLSGCGHDHGHGGIKGFTEKPYVKNTILTVHALVHIIGFLETMRFNGERRNVINHVQHELVGVAHLAFHAQHLADTATSITGLDEQALQLKLIFQQGSASFKACLKALISSFKKQSDGWVLSPVGATLYTLQLVLKHREEFQKIATLVGEIDALHAAAAYVRSEPGHWAYTEFVESGAPEVAFKEMRNPLLARGVAITDSCEWGSVSDDHVILTGPNRAGKTTYLKGLAYNVLLSHVFGIAAAQEARMTPFKGLVTFMSLNDDLINNQSRYVAQIARMDAIVSRVNACAEGEFMVVLLDDSVGQGSTQDVNERIAYEFFKLFGGYKNIIFVGATHFERLTNLENDTQGTYKNYRMRVVPSCDGVQASSTYVVEPGIADFGQVLSLVS